MKEEYIKSMLDESDFLKTLRDNNSAIVLNVREDWTVEASLRIEKTEYTFWSREIEWWWKIEPIVMPLISPEWKKLTVHIIPFNWVNVLK